MTTGTGTYDGLAVPLSGESEITQVTAATDLLTLTGVSGATGTLLTIQDSGKAPATNGLRVYDYGRTRIIRTDAAAHGGTFNNALDVKYTVSYAMGAQQVYAGTFILDVSAGSNSGGRTAVLQLQCYGNTSCTGETAASSWLLLTDLSSDDAEMGVFAHIQGIAADDGGCFVTLSDPACSKGLVLYIDNVRYYIQVSSAST